MPRLKSRVIVTVVGLLVVLAVVYSNFESLSRDADYLNRFKFDLDSTDNKPVVGQRIDDDPRPRFWNGIFNIFQKGNLNITDIGKAVDYVDQSQHLKGPNSKTVLLSKANISPEIEEELRSKHEIVKSQIPKVLDKSTYEKNSNGIVLIGGGKFSWLSYLSLVSLRKAGSILPVEIIMPQHDDFVKEQSFCSTTLPRLNAKCVVLPDILGAQVMNKWGKNFANYQFKSLALMVSSFQNVLLLDSDNVVLQNPDPLFESKLFKDYGMVLWPDYWERTISPIFYRISGIRVNEDRRVRYNRFPLAVDSSMTFNQEAAKDIPYHDLEGTIPNLSTESGQLMINKETHSCTLLLSMYYNIVGPNVYYKLFSLGQQGEGDKDTFPAAATVCREKFYQVKSFIKTFGYLNAGGEFKGVAMGQKNPLLDFQKYTSLVDTPAKTKEIKSLAIEEQISRIESLAVTEFGENSGTLFTIHCNYPKLDPLTLMSREDLYDPEANRLRYRIYGGLTFDDPHIKAKTLDFEYEQWKNMENIICNEGIEFVHFKDQNLETICSFITNQVKFLQQNPVDS